VRELDPATRDLLDRGAAELWRDGNLVGRWRTWKKLGIHEAFGSYRPEGSQPTDWGWSRLLDRIRGRRR
jgi:hypothetical protein